MKERTKNHYTFDSVESVEAVSQSICTANRNSRGVHFGQFRRNRSDECWNNPLRPSSLGSPQAHRSMGQPRLCILHLSCLSPLHLECEHLGQLAGCWERYDRLVPTLYQHQARAGYLRLSRWMGLLPMDSAREVNRCQCPRRRRPPHPKSTARQASYLS